MSHHKTLYHIKLTGFGRKKLAAQLVQAPFYEAKVSTSRELAKFNDLSLITVQGLF